MAELKVRASLDGAQFQAGLSKMGSAAGGVLGNIKSQIAAAFTVGAVTALASKTMAYADNVQEMGQRIGVSTRALQEWMFAAKQSGADAEKMVTFIERLTDAAGDLKNAKGFAAMGINPAGMTPEQLFTSVQGKTAGKSSTEIQSMMQGLGLSIRQIGPMVNMLQGDLAAASELPKRISR